ncbi:hypothetical protein [Kocuria sp.]|uniref:hypothetical protein n=1 Tax=Kocuria sp. TaxID=1871328 RepID=UPI0026DF21F2|nr:hypothetical protein [Kocuria sp.]MDO5618203.1 hypothetical protein [Kocuria sp.]
MILAIISIVVAVASVIVAALSARAAFVSAREAKAQTEHAKRTLEIQVQQREEQAQPYVWADLVPSDVTRGALELQVGNSGPTVATDVRVRFDPDPNVAHESGCHGIRQLREGLPSIAPGHIFRWRLGGAAEVVGPDEPRPMSVTVSAVGPYGPVPDLVYIIDLAAIGETTVQPMGSLYSLTEAVNKLSKQSTNHPLVDVIRAPASHGDPDEPLNGHELE